MQPENSPPDDEARGRPLALQANLLVVLLLALAAYTRNEQVGDAVLWLALGLLALALLNLLALVVATIAGQRAWAGGFALAAGLLLLSGLGIFGLLSATD